MGNKSGKIQPLSAREVQCLYTSIQPKVDDYYRTHLYCICCNSLIILAAVLYELHTLVNRLLPTCMYILQDSQQFGVLLSCEASIFERRPRNS